MRIHLALNLPREAVSVPLARHTVCSTLYTAGVEPTCVQEVEVALSEACTNAVHHAQEGITYEVMVDISDEQVTIDVVDSGSGFGQRSLTPELPHDGSENGRGMALMDALSDSAAYDTISGGDGGSVHMTKRLRWTADTLRPARCFRDGKKRRPA
jgi:serine/threonine-protein kinase RsbW